MLIENQNVRLTYTEAALASSAALDQDDIETFEFLEAKVGQVLENNDIDELTINDPIDGIPEHLHLIEFPAKSELIERIAGYIALGKVEDSELRDLARRANDGPTTERRKPEVKARHKAPFLKVVK